MSIFEAIPDSCNHLDGEAIIEFAQLLVDEEALAERDYDTFYHRFLWDYVGLVAPDGTAAEPAPYLEGHRLLEGIDCEFTDVIFSGFSSERRELVHIRRLAGSQHDMLIARLDTYSGTVTFWDEVDIETEGDVTTLGHGSSQPVIAITNLKSAPDTREFCIREKGVEYKYLPLSQLVEKVKTTTPNSLDVVVSTGALALSGSTQQLAQC